MQHGQKDKWLSKSHRLSVCALILKNFGARYEKLLNANVIKSCVCALSEWQLQVAIMNLISHPNILKCLGAGIYRDELFCLMPLHCMYCPCTNCWDLTYTLCAACSLQSLLNNSEITLSESQQIRVRYLPLRLIS